MMLRAILLMLGPAACLAACDNPVDNSVNELPYLSEQETVEDVVQEVVIGECECLAVGQTFRFDALAVASINGEDNTVIGILNTIWATDIESLELDILVDITAVSDTEVTARVYNGARVDGTQTICAFEDSAVAIVFPRDGCELKASSASDFNVYGGTEDFPKTCAPALSVKHVIPVVDAQLAGIVASDCSGISNGTVPAGALRQADTSRVCTCLASTAEGCGTHDPEYASAENKCVGCNANYQPLDTLLNTFQVDPDACTTSGGDPAACLTATWSAVTFAKPEACTP